MVRGEVWQPQQVRNRYLRNHRIKRTTACLCLKYWTFCSRWILALIFVFKIIALKILYLDDRDSGSFFHGASLATPQSWPGDERAVDSVSGVTTLA